VAATLRDGSNGDEAILCAVRGFWSKFCGRARVRVTLRGPGLALLLGLAAFGFYGVTMGNLVGYEDETAAVTEGLVRDGQLRVLPHTPLTDQGTRGRDGRLYSRTGLTQPFLEAPFYWVGEQFDEIGSGGANYRWRDDLLRLYDPAMAALTVVAIFGLLILRGVSERRALAVGGLAAVASMVWPYSKIGMETTLMAMLALSFLAAAWAARRPSALRFLLAGVACGLTANSKPYGGLLLIGVLPLLVQAFRALPREQRMRSLGAFLAPMIVAVVAIGWYNWYRSGSVTNFVDMFQSTPVAAPISALGLFLSPGKGLLWYSPLVILGLRGWRTMSHGDRPLALGVLLAVAMNTAVISIQLVWSDETWGPRYLVPSAWLLLLPLAWWAHGRRRMRWMAALTVLAIWVQFIGVLPAYSVIIPINRALADGAPVYADGVASLRVPYGDDGPRWIPGASPLLYQSALALAYLKEKLTGSGFTILYRPLEGYYKTIDLRAPQDVTELPDFWWRFSGMTSAQDVLVVLLGVMALGGGIPLVRRLRRPSAALVGG
jgi:hypothetical protein